MVSDESAPQSSPTSNCQGALTPEKSRIILILNDQVDKFDSISKRPLRVWHSTWMELATMIGEPIKAHFKKNYYY